MKIEANTQTIFNPVTIKIVIESEEELKAVWAIANPRISEVMENSPLVKKGLDEFFVRNAVSSIFSVVDSVAKNKGVIV